MPEKPKQPNKPTAVRSPPTRIREQYRLMTQERLVKAAVGVFMERGYTEATIDEIVAVAGVSRATFYLHFKSKVELMRAIITETDAENRSLLDELRGKQALTRQDISVWLRRFIAHVLDEGDRFVVGLQALASEKELDRDLQIGIQMATTIVAGFIRERQPVSEQEAQIRAELLVYALQHACRRAAVQPDYYTLDLVVNAMTETWADGLHL